MPNAHSTLVYKVSVATRHADADAYSTLLVPTSQGPAVFFTLFAPAGEAGELTPCSKPVFASDGEHLVSVWSKCVGQVAPDQGPHRDSRLDFVSVSVYLCEERSSEQDLQLLEHLVVHRQGSRLLVEFSNEESSIERVGVAKGKYANSFEVAVHAVGIAQQSNAWRVTANASSQACGWTVPKRE